MKEYTCEIKLHFVGNNKEANNVEEYKKLIVEQYQEEYNIALDENEIENIEERINNDTRRSTKN
tara:strand:+ start:345 stop:536 length:192 start_codon:yes stop_codon:yes gene_type:complete